MALLTGVAPGDSTISLLGPRSEVITDSVAQENFTPFSAALARSAQPVVFTQALRARWKSWTDSLGAFQDARTLGTRPVGLVGAFLRGETP